MKDRLVLVNESLRKHDYRIVFDGTNYQVAEIGVRGFTADRLFPERYASIQMALDWLASICRKASIASY